MIYVTDELNQHQDSNSSYQQRIVCRSGRILNYFLFLLCQKKKKGAVFFLEINMRQEAFKLTMQAFVNHSAPMFY